MATLNLTSLDPSLRPIDPDPTIQDCGDGFVQNEEEDVSPLSPESFRDPNDEYIPQTSRLTETERREASQGAAELHAHIQRLWQEMTSAHEEARAIHAYSMEIVDGFERELTYFTQSSFSFSPEDARANYLDWAERHAAHRSEIQENTDRITRCYYKMRAVYQEARAAYAAYWNRYSYDALPFASDSSALLEEMRKDGPPDRLIFAEAHYYEQGHRAELQMNILPSLSKLPDERRRVLWSAASRSTLDSEFMRAQYQEIRSRQDRLIELLRSEDARKERELEATEGAIRVRIEEQRR